MPEKQTTRPEEDRGVLLAERQKTKKPRMYKVLLHNDDYTPMDFVTMVLMTVFNKDMPDAVRIMLAVHRQGRGLAGVYTRDVAESKVQRVTELARSNEHPLLCTCEPE